MTSSPGWVWARMAAWLAIVPLGKKQAASLPNSAATRSCRRFTVGSSPRTSSPSSAARIASHMEGVGRVTVSERRSIVSVMLRGLRERLYRIACATRK